MLSVRGLGFAPLGLRDVSFDVPAGGIVAVVGPNGAGKTTLLRCVLGFKRPTAGVVSRPATVGCLIEGAAGYPELSARQNLVIGAKLHGVDHGAVVGPALRTWGLGEVAERRFGNLSQGLQQRVGLARATQHRPELLVLDEPTNALDPLGVVLLREQLLDHARAGAAVLVSSHHLDEVARIARRILVLNRGCVIGEIDPAQPDIEREFFAKVVEDEHQHRARR
ncbi:ABC transporter ATP-binding protein [Corynebacterium sp.]|uniref:ABC transporter ATP-binding protein n=1 Tax=Corynebacterium sp. TaxID=1720 RepID=UPI0026DBA0D9|nr:ATP-binding cassette domain-containing protein [Corynebacterium sp.]MDO5077946.1 ATP-binding cassette domain-containing protein [Corynebacterium sp.]